MFHLDGSNTCWLIYADWLYDHNQPEKADLIRQQIEHKKRRLLTFGHVNNVGGGGEFNIHWNAVGSNSFLVVGGSNNQVGEPDYFHLKIGGYVSY